MSKASMPQPQPATIVVVDDDPIALGLMEEIIAGIPDATAAVFGDPAEALAWCQACSPDVIVSDYQMPEMDGLQLLEQLRFEEQLRDVPIMIVTSVDGRYVRQRALELGANDFLTKPFDAAEVGARVKNMILVHQAQRTMRVRAQELALQVDLASSAVTEREREAMARLARVAEYRDWGSDAHVTRVAHTCRIVARGRGLSDADQARLVVAAPLHDIGKIGIPDRILLKPGALDAEELKIMRQHTLIGQKLLGGATSDALRYAAVLAHTHHERMDGTGYPDGLRGDQIPVGARILAVADVFDALTSRRHHREAWTAEAAAAYLRNGAGTQFDGLCVDALLAALPEVLELRRRFPDHGSRPVAPSEMPA